MEIKNIRNENLTLFFLFLESEGMLDEYLNEIVSGDTADYIFVESNILVDYLYTVITSSFKWGMTKKGAGFWIKFDGQWCDFLRGEKWMND